MNLIKYLLVFSFFYETLFAAALPAKAKLTPCRKSTGDEFILTHCNPYLGGSRSPGDSVGTTAMDNQTYGGCLKRIYVDDSFQVHIAWIKMPYPPGYNNSRLEWNFRYNDGTYFGELDAGPLGNRQGSLDLTQDIPIQWQRSVITWIYNSGSNANYSYYDVDAGNGYGVFPNDPKQAGGNNWLWPMVAAAKNGNYLVATHYNEGPYNCCNVTTDNGTTWNVPFISDSCANNSQYIIASRLSNKVGYVETRFFSDSIPTVDNNIWFRLSNDGGVTWGPHTNITHYQAGDTFRAYTGVSCNFDQDDKFHVVWSARKVQNGEYYDASKIMHWDEVHDSITVVSQSTGLFEGGWWGWDHPNGFGFNLPADEPLLSYNPNDQCLYCFWTGQNDTTDYSQNGWPNGDIYGSRSIDGGLNWSMWFNITNTHTPGAPPGSCEDEGDLSVCPYAKRDSFFILYVEDKDAGASSDTTNNIVRLLTIPDVHVDVTDRKNTEKIKSGISLNPVPTARFSMVTFYLPVKSEISLKLFDITGQLVKMLDGGEKSAGNHTTRIDTRGLTAGTYFVILDTPERNMIEKMIVVR